MYTARSEATSRNRDSRARTARRRVARRLGRIERWGSEPVAINDLISPLRYDILVRQRYFEFLKEHRDLLESDLTTLIQASHALPYFTWFAKVVIPRFRPELLGRPDLIEQAFGVRVEASAALLRSFERDGFDPRRPLVVETGRIVEPTTTGKHLRRRIFPGDGCHRLALLRASGVSALEPRTYRVRSVRRFTPRDNTALLVRDLGVRPDEYLEFLGLSYRFLIGQLSDTDSEPDSGADELAELRELVRVDAPLVPGLTRRIREAAPVASSGVIS